jgi:predicted PurR-regulated permease PerM
MSIAILLSFVLAPVTDVLSRLRIGRIASALIAVALAFAILGILGAIIGRQAAQLSESLPAYQIEISKKLDAVRSSAFGARMVEKAADALHGLENNIGKNAVPAPRQPAQEQTAQAVDHPLQVEVHEPPPGPVQILQSILSALLPPLATAAIVIIFVVFILLQRRDLRDRFIGLIGSEDLHRTTKALDDAAQRLTTATPIMMVSVVSARLPRSARGPLKGFLASRSSTFGIWFSAIGGGTRDYRDSTALG